MNENDRKFFTPLWRRIVIVIFCAGWTIWELSNGETLWAGLTATIAFYCIWHLFIRFEPPEQD